MKHFVISCFFLVCGSIVFGQSKDDIIQERIEFIAQDLEVEDISLEDVFEVLDVYYDNKLNLNTATKEQLQELLMINDFQINALLEWREEKGLFKTVFEIQNVDYWDLVTLNNIFPFVQVSEVQEKKQDGNLKRYFKEGIFEGYVRFIRNIEPKAGYEKVSEEEKENSSRYYWGDPNRLYSRLRFTHRQNLSMGVTMTKAPGEQVFGKTQPYGFDFYSGHFYYDNGKKFLRKIAVGDYQMQVGQGLAFWTGYGFSKTADASSAKRKARGLRAFTSTDEARYLRGAAVEIGINDFSLTTWVSYKGMDGSVAISDTLEDEEARMASSINMSGYHRTISELDRKNSLKELIYGANLKYTSRNFQAGISAIQQSYDVHYQRAENLTNKYQFSGKELLNLSADYSYLVGKISLYGEIAQSRSSNAVAVLQGASLALNRRVILSALYRNYPKDYHTFYARGFGDGGNTINESGLYFGGHFKLSKDWTLNSYIDFFQSPWLKYRADAPTKGNEVLGQLTYRPNSRFETFIRVREKNKQVNASGSVGNMRPLEDERQRRFQWSMTTTLAGGWRWKSRIDYVTYERKSKGLQNGYALTQDLLYRNANSPLEVSLRYSIFNTDSYDARMYVYEYNMQNVFSIPTYYNKGSRAYVLLRYTFFKEKFDIWARYGIFVYDQLEKISSGAEEIQGNVKSEIGLQLRVKL